jgi:hypothetical protein
MGALRFLCGGVVSGMILIGGIFLWRGSVNAVISPYRDLGVLHANVPVYTIFNHFIRYGLSAVSRSLTALTVSVAALFILARIAFSGKDRKLVLRFGFWLAFIAAGLVEPIMKVGYPYHFSVTLPAFAGICALALREIIRAWPRVKCLNGERKNFLMAGGAVALLIWVFLRCSTLLEYYWPMTVETLVAAPSGNWP